MFKTVEQKGFTAQSEFFADQVINHGISVNRDAVRAILQDILNAFPDVKIAIKTRLSLRTFASSAV